MADRIAERLTHFRELRGLTKGEMARRLGYRTVATISHWETRKRTPTAENLRRVATVLDCTVNDLDPEGEAFTDGQRPPRRPKPGATLQKSRTSADSAGAAPQPGDPPEPEVLMDARTLLAIPDAEMFQKVLGVWLTLDTQDDRADFLEHARGFRGGARGARTKNNRR